MKIIKLCTISGGLIAIVVFWFTMGFSEKASAMPVFARKVQTSCITCHSSFPTLNINGDVYRLNGYRFPDNEIYLKQEPLSLGNESYKRLWPEAMWPGEIPQHFPISIITVHVLEWSTDPRFNNKTGKDEADFSFVVPHEIEMNYSTDLGDEFAVYSDIRYISDDNSGEDFTSWAMLKTWFMYKGLFGLDNKLRLTAGSLGMHTLCLYTAKDEGAMAFEGYQHNNWEMPDLKRDMDGNILQQGISEFKGNTFSLQPQPGFELSGVTKNIFYYAGIVNGNIIKDSSNQIYFEGTGKNTGTKDYYGGLAIKFGGIGFDGSGSEDTDLAASKPSDYWRDDSLTLSLFGYSGTGRIESTTENTGHVYTNDRFWRFGGSFLQRYHNLSLGGGFMLGNNETPYGNLSDAEVDSTAWYIDGHYFVYSWLIPFAKYEVLEFDGLPSELMIVDSRDRSILTSGVKMHFRPNITLRIEYVYYTEDDGFEYGKDKDIFFVLHTAF